MKPIVHVGYPKTGTTWFQTVFFPNVQNVKYISKEEVKKNIIEPSFFEFNALNIKDLVFDEKEVTYLLSSEDFIGAINAGWNRGLSMKENALRIKQIFGDVTIVLFIRNQIELLSSAYSQYIKNGGTYKIKKYLTNFKQMLFSKDHLDFYSTIKFYEDYFGKDNVHIFLYEDFEKNPRDFVKMFSEKYKLNFDENEINFDLRVNRKLHPRLTNSLRKINKLSSHGNAFKNYYIHVPPIHLTLRKFIFWLNERRLFSIQESFSKKILKKQYQEIYDFYSEKNRMLINEYDLVNIKEYNYPI